MALFKPRISSIPRATRVALLWSAVVLLSALVALAPIHDAATGVSSLGVHLTMPWPYQLLAPVCSILDTLSVLSVRQHVVLLLAYLLVYGFWRVIRRAALRAAHPEYRRPIFKAIALETVWALGAVVAFAAVYVAGIAIPRPMTGIALADPDAVVVDFHSHTNASWDGVKRFTPEANRAWHRDAGFDVAYISDHATVAGALRGMARNPQVAGTDVVLLPAVEERFGGEHIIALGIRPDRDVHADGEWRMPAGVPARVPAHVSTRANANESGDAEADEPLLTLTIPGTVRNVPASARPVLSQLRAIELEDASPKGIDQIQREQGRVMALSDSLDLAVISGSDNHGWGSTAAAWSVLHIPNWRTMSPVVLDAAIRHTIETERRHAVQVLMRRTPNPGASIGLLALTPIAVPVNYLRTLSWPERMSWLAWIWAAWCVTTLVPVAVPVRRPVVDDHVMAPDFAPELIPEVVADE